MPYSGKLADPSFRSERARAAALTRTTLDHHIQRLVDAAPQMTEEQRARIAALLAPNSASEASAA